MALKPIFDDFVDIPPANIDAAIATQAQAEAGTDNAKMMTPLRTAQEIDAFIVPANLSIPTITAGTYVARPFAATTGAWSNGATNYAYQWFQSDNGTEWTFIGGATSDIFTPGEELIGKYIRVGVKATNIFGDSKPAYSASSAALLAAIPFSAIAIYPLTTNGNDTSGNENDLSATNTPTFGVDGATFDGTSWLSTSAPLLSPGDFSLAFWVKADSASQLSEYVRVCLQTDVGVETGGEGFIITPLPVGNRIVGYIPGGPSANAGLTLDGNPHFVKVRYTLVTNTMEVGVDTGAMNARSGGANAFATATQVFVIGGSDFPLVGSIRQMNVFQAAISNTQFETLRQATLP